LNEKSSSIQYLSNPMRTTVTFYRKRAFLLLFICFATHYATAQLQAAFTATPLSGCAPLLVRFTDQSTGNPTSWNWNLGNGTTSIIQNPSVTYFTPGTYNIKLVVRNAANTADSITKTDYITVHARPTVSFTASDTTGCYPLPVQFTDNSSPGSGQITAWQWDFGDGSTSILQNPFHTYQQGTYNVVLRVTNDKGCPSTITKFNYIKATEGVTANFTFNNPNTCNPPVTINFANLSTGTGTLSYQWNFGDGFTSTLLNPSHTYTNPGSYAVTLIVVNNTGCSDTIVKPNAITVGNTNAAFTSADSVCEDQPLAITNTSTPAPTAALWYFGDGSTSTQLNPIKIYNNPGVYTIKLVSDFGACRDSVTKNITVLQKPAAAFTSTSPVACKAPLTVTFNNTTTGGVSYEWTFGDGGTSTGTSPAYTYNAPGEYDVTLVATNALGCTDTLRRIKYVVIKPMQLSFINLPDSGCRPLTIAPLANIVTVDGIAGYVWNFGDGFTSTAASPVHTYNTAGVYNITLAVTTNGGCTDSVTAFVRVGDKPQVNFSATPLDACANESIQFSDATVGSPLTYFYWQFGDGSSSYTQNPQHQYNDTGWFSVTLIVGSNGCYDTLVKPLLVHIKPPIARFTPSFNCGNPYQITFTDQSIAPLTWAWTFGDGNTSNAQSPVHTYASPGTYTVSLTVTNGNCQHTTAKTITIIDDSPDFSASQVQICRNTTVTFTSFGYSRANVTSMIWDFGDGTIITGDSVITHTYLVSGIYTVKLKITYSNNCTEEVVKLQYITVFGPKAAFTAVAGTCINSPVIFNDQSTTDGVHPIQQWVWNYGDGITETLTAPPFTHQYTTAGTYPVWLKITDNYGCTDSLYKPNFIIISKPVADFASADTLSCPGKPIVFTSYSVGNGLSFTWNFGDGNTSAQQSPTHQYSAPGVYTVKLFITDLYGCTDSLVRNQYVKIDVPRALFTMSDSVGTCPPLFVAFTNQSTYASSLMWNFGDGATSTDANPSHFYTTPGNFTATLTIVSPGGCVDVMQKVIRLNGPTGQFTYGPTSGCKPLTIQFTATSANTVNYVWDYNNGETFSTSSSTASYTYTVPGVYLPRLILQDAAGCSIPILGNDSVKVYGVQLNIAASSTLLCDSGLVAFTSQYTGNDVVSSYLWNFGNGATATTANPSYYYTSSGNYNIRCEVITQQGCRDTSYLNLPMQIVQSPLIDIAGDTANCVPATAQFSGQVLRADTAALTWKWNFGNGQTGNTINPAPVTYTNAGVYVVTSIAANSSGCADTSTRNYTVWALPVIDAGADRQICRGTPVQLTATGASQYTWSPAAGLSCSNCATPLAAPDSTALYWLDGTDQNGCKNRDSVKVAVVQRFNMNQSPAQEFCKGKLVTLFANGADRYTWSPGTGLSATTGAQVVARPNVTTTYMVVGHDRFNCFTDTGYIPLTVYPIPTVNAGPDQTIVGGSTAQLLATASPDVTTYKWSPATTLSCYNCPNPGATPNQTTKYNVEVSNLKGCSSSDEVTVFVLCDKGNLFIPNTFSPNGDGVNDLLYPRGKGIYTIKSFKIFNRWGELVFEAANFSANDPSKAWNGTFNGKKLNPDVYVYLIDVICDNKSVLGFKGNISLIE
jgi:gliding motility-associated-like protein